MSFCTMKEALGVVGIIWKVSHLSHKVFTVSCVKIEDIYRCWKAYHRIVCSSINKGYARNGTHTFGLFYVSFN